jgi:hypothetical protein
MPNNQKISSIWNIKNMTATFLVNSLFEEAQQLPAAYRAALAEKIVESIEADIPESIEKAHLEEIKRRQLEVDSGSVSFIDGDQVMHAVRARLK